MNINLSDLEPITIDLDESNSGKTTNFGENRIINE